MKPECQFLQSPVPPQPPVPSFGIGLPSVRHSPLPWQSFLPLVAPQPPLPLQAFWPLQVCFSFLLLLAFLPLSDVLLLSFSPPVCDDAVALVPATNPDSAALTNSVRANFVMECSPFFLVLQRRASRAFVTATQRAPLMRERNG